MGSELNKIKTELIEDLDKNLEKVFEIKTMAETLVVKINTLGKLTEKIQNVYKKRFKQIVINDEQLNKPLNTLKINNRKKQKIKFTLNNFALKSIQAMISLIQICTKQRKN